MVGSVVGQYSVSSLVQNLGHGSVRSLSSCLLRQQEMHAQARLAGPLGADLVLTHTLTLVALAFTAQLGLGPLAVVALGTTVYELAGRLVLSGLSNALDTAAAQACTPAVSACKGRDSLLQGCSPHGLRCINSRISDSTRQMDVSVPPRHNFGN